MADRWYFAHDDKRTGPCTGRQLKDLAACGKIKRTVQAPLPWVPN